jgi:hypothetical protein
MDTIGALVGLALLNLGFFAMIKGWIVPSWVPPIFSPSAKVLRMYRLLGFVGFCVEILMILYAVVGQWAQLPT